MSNFQALEVVGRGSETQLKMIKNLNVVGRGSETQLQMIKNLNERKKG